MKLSILVPIGLHLLVSCSTLPNPSKLESRGGPTGEGREIMMRSAAAHGHRWNSYQRVDVSLEGTWSGLATRIQPVLTDPGFRKDSTESYFPESGRVLQEHVGPDGTKSVRRTRNEIVVSYRGTRETDPEQLDASALVADAYTAFLFGPSWLLESGESFRYLTSDELDSETCDLVYIPLRPGFGRADDDHVIAWVSRESGLLRRLQFTLNGLESTRGADVDVTFSEMRTADDGSVWPTHFLEHVQRPLRIKAHEWKCTRLVLDGEKIF